MDQWLIPAAAADNYTAPIALVAGAEVGTIGGAVRFGATLALGDVVPEFRTV